MADESWFAAEIARRLVVGVVVDDALFDALDAAAGAAGLGSVDRWLAARGMSWELRIVEWDGVGG